ncbi:MAG: Ig-like domain-containing protein, partial [Lachnospiraceae bacterium]|nr:Ig-like domain-containing protein [Lachnospiraceae bacterium]
EASFEGLKYKSVNPVIYPGSSLNIETVFANGSFAIPSVYKFMIYNELDEDFYSEVNGLKVTGNKITGTNDLKKTTPGKKHVIGLVNTRNRSVAVCSGVETYPAGTSSIDLNFYSDPNANNKTFYVAPGFSWKLMPSSNPTNACQKYYTFKSGNTKVVTVDEAGMVKAVGNGKTTVTVTAGDGSNKTAKINIEVAKKPESLEISTKTGELKAVSGKSINLIATVKPDDAANKKVTWWLNEGDPATLSQNGTLKINSDVSSGMVTVYAEAAGNTMANDNVQIEFRPETKSIDLVDDQVKKKGVTVFTQNIGTCKTTASFSAEVRSKQAGQRPFDPSVASSNSNVSVVKTGNTASPYPPKYTYTVTANGTKAENATITIAATDGSNKKATVKVTVLVPVTELSLKAKDGIATVTPGKSITLVAETNKDASNKKVKWSFESDAKEAELKAAGIDTEKFKKSGKISMARTSTLNSTFKVGATAEDGSGTYDEFTVTAKPAAVTAVTITGDDNKQVKETRLGFFRGGNNDTGRDSSDPFCISRFFKIDFSGTGDYQNVPIVTSSDERIVRAEFVNRKDGADGSWLRVYTYEYNKFQATKTGKATVTVKSADGSNKSAKISVSVKEPVRSISISADQSGRCIAANGKIKMRAAVPETASNKKVNWRLEYSSGLEVQKDVATISASGDLKPNSKLQNPVEIKVVATPADGAKYFQRVTPQQFVPVSASETITLYPAQGAIVFLHNNAPSKNSTLKVGDELEMDVAPDLSYNLVPYRDYLVTYQTGPIKVSYVSRDKNGTKIKIKCLKAGTSTITAAARDGSGKKATFKVTVKKP